MENAVAAGPREAGGHADSVLSDTPLFLRRNFLFRLSVVTVLGVVYVVAGRFGLGLAFLHPSATPIWAPTGIALAALLFLGYRVWPAIFLGAFFLNLFTAGSLVTSFGIATGNTLEGLLGAYLVTRFANGIQFPANAGSFLRFVVLAGMVSTAVSATIGVTSLALAGFAPWTEYRAIWFTWWLGDMVGNLVFAPLLVVWILRPLPRMSARRAMEGVYLLSAIMLLSMIFFLEGSVGSWTQQLYYLAFLPLGWGAFRFEQRGAIVSVCLLSCPALWGTLNGLGPFAMPDPNLSLLLLQIFVGSMSIMGLLLASVVSEHRSTTDRLRVKDAVSMVLAGTLSLKDAAPRIIQLISEIGGWDAGVLLVPDERTDEIVPAGTWHSPGQELQEFEKSIRRTRYSPGSGLPGLVWRNGEPAWVTDLTIGSSFPQGLVDARCGMIAAFCFPVRSDERTLGVLCFFSRKMRTPDISFLSTMAAVGNQLGLFVERRSAEHRLRASEEHKAAILNSAVDAIITVDREGRITEFNPGAERMFGYRAAESIGRAAADLIVPESARARYREAFEEYAATGKGVVIGRRVVMQLARADGSGFPAEISVVRLGNGAGSSFTGFVTDITDRKKSEDALRTAHDELDRRVRERTEELEKINQELRVRDAQLSTAQRIAHLGGWEWNLGTSRVVWSDELYNIFGVSRDAFAGTMEDFFEMVHPDDRSAVIDQMEEAVRAHRPFDFLQRIIRPDGSVRVVQQQGRVVVDESGDLVKVDGICLDVTDRTKAEQRFRGLLESAPDAMVIVNTDGQIVLVNVQTERMFGYARAQLLGQSMEILLPERFRGRHANYRGEYMRATRSRPMGEGLELYGLRKDGSEFPIEVSLSPLDTEEGVLISSAIRDITEQTQLRARLVEAERRRSADLRRYLRSVQKVQEEERQRIARELHDDLCQRLSGMKLNIEVLADGLPPRNKALYRKLRSFNKQCEEMIIDVRRMSANLRPAVLDDFGLVTTLELLTRAFQKQHNIPVDMDVGESTTQQLDSQVEIALYRIAQEALANVATHAGASRVSLTLERNDLETTLQIRDDGKGANLNEVTSRRARGYGLGLISMRERTELLGGTFGVESTPGKGTTISVVIPAARRTKGSDDAVPS